MLHRILHQRLQQQRGHLCLCGAGREVHVQHHVIGQEGQQPLAIVAEELGIPAKDIQIEEGDRAKIRQVNIVGNTSFDEEEIIADFELSTGNWLSFIRNNDRYSREALTGDLDKLRSFYMDRGYADFREDDVQVAISPDKRDIFITISITEGDQYTISDVKLAGEMVVPERELELLMLAQPGQTFSQAVLTAAEELMAARLGQDGYAFAEIRAVPELDEEAKTAAITFFVDPHNRVYVRRINFNGADNVNDEVFRREMRQMEGGYLSNALVENSKLFLQRLPYVESVEHETTPVPGSPDLVDIDFEIEEGLPGQFGGSLGFSETFGVTLGGQFIHSNFLGTGRRVALQLNGGEYQKIYDINFTDPYRNIDGVARTISFTYQDYKQFTSATSDFSTKTLSGGLNWGYPIADFQRLNFGFAYQDAELLASDYSSIQAKEWVQQNGNPFSISAGLLGTRVKSLEVVAGWTYDTRNAALFPTAGTRLTLGLNTAVPGSDVEYYVASADFTKYVDLPGRWLFRVHNELYHGDAFGDTTALPPFRNRYGGGPGSVRGFKESYLGPRDTPYGNPYGGIFRPIIQPVSVFVVTILLFAWWWLIGWLGFYNHNWSDDIPSWNERDRAQGRNLMLVMEKHGAARAILSAHTSHVSHGRSRADWWGYGDLKSGVFFFTGMTRKKVFNIALTAYSASGTQGEWSLPTAKNSIDRRLHDAGHAFSFFTADAAFLRRTVREAVRKGRHGRQDGDAGGHRHDDDWRGTPDCSGSLPGRFKR